MKLKPGDMEKWVEALRSGDYEQGKNALEDPDGRMCCLGVLCAIKGVDVQKSFDDDGAWANVRIYSGLNEELGSKWCDYLITMNDNGETFEEIANYIEESLK